MGKWLVLSILMTGLLALAVMADPVVDEDSTSMTGFSTIHTWSSLSHPGAGPFQAAPMMGNVDVPFQCQHQADATRVAPLAGAVSWWVKMTLFYSENVQVPTSFTSVSSVPNYFLEWDNNQGGVRNTGGVVINNAGDVSMVCPGNWLAYGHTGIEEGTEPVLGVTAIRAFTTVLAP